MKKNTSSNSNLLTVLEDAFTIKKTPFPWERAICAGICSAVPVLIGLLFGNFQYGLIAGIGGFSYLYVWNEPYPERAKKIFFVALGLAVSNRIGNSYRSFTSCILRHTWFDRSSLHLYFWCVKNPWSCFYIFCYRIRHDFSITC